MKKWGIRRRLLIVFGISFFLFVIVLGLLSGSLGDPWFVTGTTVFSVALTFVYYAIVLFARWIGDRFGKEGEQKAKYIFSGALLCNLMPFLGILWLWPLVTVYMWPATVVSNVFGAAIPALSVTIPFWAVAGSIGGYVAYKMRRSQKITAGE
ncbi:MAG: hypothetical protein KGI69_00720 [Patescibacteria group bacterium]|nr:hypothetical protein [Patescibacteria group bacterium]